MQRLKPTLDKSRDQGSEHLLPTTTTDPWEGVDYRPLADCPMCHGAGFMHPVVNGMVNYSRIIPCNHPGCLASSFRGYRTGDAYAINKGVTAVEQTFETFRKVKGTEDALKYATQFASDDISWFFLLIHGGVGNGKTHLCNAIARKMLGRGMSVQLYTATKLLSKLRTAMQDHSVDAVLDELKNVLVLLIDDLGVEYGSDWERATLEDLLTSRWALGWPTVVTTNLDIKQLPDRIRSRFSDQKYARAAANMAPDYRSTR